MYTFNKPILINVLLIFLFLNVLCISDDVAIKDKKVKTNAKKASVHSRLKGMPGGIRPGGPNGPFPPNGMPGPGMRGPVSIHYLIILVEEN